jgi:hypothetical protein
MTSLFTSETVFFVPNKKQIVESLFKGPNTASGTYKVRKGGILFFDPQDTPRVFLVAHSNTEPFFVTCCRHSLQSNRLRYMHAVCSLDRGFFGIKGLSYMQEMDLAASLWKQVTSQSKTLEAV